MDKRMKAVLELRRSNAAQPIPSRKVRRNDKNKILKDERNAG
jgi:hypothetical protein